MPEAPIRHSRSPLLHPSECGWWRGRCRGWLRSRSACPGGERRRSERRSSARPRAARPGTRGRSPGRGWWSRRALRASGATASAVSARVRNAAAMCFWVVCRVCTLIWLRRSTRSEKCGLARLDRQRPFGGEQLTDRSGHDRVRRARRSAASTSRCSTGVSVRVRSARARRRRVCLIATDVGLAGRAGCRPLGCGVMPRECSQRCRTAGYRHLIGWDGV